MIRVVFGNLLLIAAYVGCAQLAQLMAVPHHDFAPLRPETGLAIAAVGMRGLYLLGGVFIGAMIDSQLGAQALDPVMGLLTALLITVQAGLLGWMARRYLRGIGDLTTGVSLLRALIVIAPLSGAFSAAMHYLLGSLPTLPEFGLVVKLACEFSAAAFGVIAMMPLAYVILERREPRRTTRSAMLTALLLGLLLVVTTAYRAERDRVSDELYAELREIAANSAARMENYLDTYIVALRAVEALFASSTEVTREEYDSFSRSLQKALPGLYATAWDAFVPDSERDAFVQRMRETGLPDFEIFEVVDGVRRVAPRRPYTVPVAYARYEGEPLKALGFDMASEPTRKAALDQALRTGEPTASGRVKLVTDPDPDYDILILMTMRGGERQELIGYSGLAVRVSELFDFALGEPQDGLLMRLFDRSAKPENAWLHGAPEELVPPAGSVTVTREMEIAGREWEFELIAEPRFASRYFPTQAVVILWGGLALVLMLCTLVMDLTARRRRAA